MNTIVAPKNVKVSFLVSSPVKATKSEVQEVVAEVSRAVNVWLYAGQSDWLFA